MISDTRTIFFNVTVNVIFELYNDDQGWGDGSIDG